MKAFFAEYASAAYSFLKFKSSRSKAPAELRAFSNTLKDINDQFIVFASRYRILSCLETKGIRPGGLVGLYQTALCPIATRSTDEFKIVEAYSATLDLPDELRLNFFANYEEICKFSNEKVDRYISLLDQLRILVDEAIAVGNAETSAQFASSKSSEALMDRGDQPKWLETRHEPYSNTGSTVHSRTSGIKRSIADEGVPIQSKGLSKRNIRQDHAMNQNNEDIEPPPAVRYNVPHFSGGAYYSRGMLKVSLLYMLTYLYQGSYLTFETISLGETAIHWASTGSGELGKHSWF